MPDRQKITLSVGFQHPFGGGPAVEQAVDQPEYGSARTERYLEID